MAILGRYIKIMPSFIWSRDPEEAYSEPYEYDAQEQFSREAESVIAHLKDHYSLKNDHFSIECESSEKAIWLLQVDGLEALNDILYLICSKKHRIASRLFRDTVETLDLSIYLTHGGQQAQDTLEKWYKNEVIPHRRYRNYVKNRKGDEESEKLATFYSELSKYTHRTYKAITRSYIRGTNENLYYDGFRDNDDLVTAQIISFSYAVLAMLINRFVDISVETNQLEQSKVSEIWNNSLEKETVPRRFGQRIDGSILVRGKSTKIN